MAPVTLTCIRIIIIYISIKQYFHAVAEVVLVLATYTGGYSNLQQTVIVSKVIICFVCKTGVEYCTEYFQC